MNEMSLPILLLLLASLFQGTFGLGMKYIKPLAWEAWWLVHATVAMLLFPWIWALLVVPDLRDVLAQSPSDAVAKAALYGFLWGIGGIMFGVSVRYVGMALTYGIVMGLAALIGALIPLVQRGQINNPATPYVILAMAVMLTGVAMAAYAGIRRDQVQVREGKQIAGIQQGRAFRLGLAIAITSGVLSALLAVGFDNAQAIGDKAVQLGALQRNSALARWVVVLAGAYLMNGGYALFLLAKNRTFGSFATPGGEQAYKWAVIAGLLWFAALGVFGQGAALMGDLGTVIAWPMLLGLALIVSTALAFWSGEWKGAPGPARMMIAGVGVLLLACVVLGYANSVRPQTPSSPAAAEVGTAATEASVCDS
jgi:L-rhamnose-H+ transport protein